MSRNTVVKVQRSILEAAIERTPEHEDIGGNKGLVECALMAWTQNRLGYDPATEIHPAARKEREWAHIMASRFEADLAKVVEVAGRQFEAELDRIVQKWLRTGLHRDD